MNGLNLNNNHYDYSSIIFEEHSLINIASYSLLTHIIAHFCGLEATDFYYHLGNSHIYDDHIDSLKEQIKKKPFCFPKLIINRKPDKIEDYCIDDFSILDYQHHQTIKMEMRK